MAWMSEQKGRIYGTTCGENGQGGRDRLASGCHLERGYAVDGRGDSPETEPSRHTCVQ